jgi:hypothetical protein
MSKAWTPQVKRQAPVHRINRRARINHANRSGSPRRPQAAATLERNASSVTFGISGNRLWAGYVQR